MSGSIRLHPKHGLNPTMPQCYWCGEDTGEIALLGAAYKGEAPRHMVISKEPCLKCQSNWAQGIVLFEGNQSGGDMDLTGRWVVMKEEAIERLFSPAELVQQVLKSRRAVVEPELFNALFTTPKEES